MKYANYPVVYIAERPRPYEEGLVEYKILPTLDIAKKWAEGKVRVLKDEGEFSKDAKFIWKQDGDTWSYRLEVRNIAFDFINVFPLDLSEWTLWAEGKE